MRQLLGQGAGRQVQAAAREFAFAVAEGGFYDKVTHGHRVNPVPERLVAFGVTAEDPPARVPPHGEADGRDGVACGERLDLCAINRYQVASLEGLVSEEWRRLRWNGTEVWPDDVVEHMGLERLDGGGQCVNLYGAAAQG